MLAPWKHCYDQLRQHIKKKIHCFANKCHLVQAMVFPVVMYGCENWTIKKAECQRINAFVVVVVVLIFFYLIILFIYLF